MKRGRAWRFGDNIDIDLILPTQYIALPPDTYKDHCMEGVSPSFSQEIRRGDYIVAGKNIGCGNTHHQGNIAIRDLGITGVIAESFGRNFFRASVSVGLHILECSSASKISEGDEIEADFRTGKIVNLTKNEKIYVFFSNFCCNYGIYQGKCQCLNSDNIRMKILNNFWKFFISDMLS